MNSKMTDKEKLSQVFGIHSSNEVDTFDAWTKEIAEKKAEAMGLVLTDKHWEVINFLRVLYQNVGAQMPPVHELSQTLEERFSEQGGLRYLFELFPDGPLDQGSLIAGVPVPDEANDSSFGSKH